MDSSDRLPKHLLVGFVLAAVLYAAFFVFDQGMRKRKGPWEVRFHTNERGHAAITVNQPTLGIKDVNIEFEGESVTNAPAVIQFTRPNQPIPFGKLKFDDLTYLPGSVAFDFFGHEVELLPRTLYLNKEEHSWASNQMHVLEQDEKLPPEKFFDPKKKKKRGFMSR